MSTGEMPRCTATTKAGKPCKQRPLKGRDVCKQHSGDPDVGRRLQIQDAGELILTALRTGAFAQDAARAAGVHPATYFRWMEHGEADAAGYDRAIAAGNDQEARQYDTPQREFYEAATRAKGEARLAAVGHLRMAMKEDWRAAAFYLERTDPENWGRSQKVALSGHVTGDGRGGRMDLSQLDDDELDTLDSLIDRATSVEG